MGDREKGGNIIGAKCSLAFRFFAKNHPLARHDTEGGEEEAERSK